MGNLMGKLTFPKTTKCNTNNSESEDLQWLKQAVFDNELIVSRITSFLSHSDWKRMRLVNSIWLRETNQYFFKKSIVILKSAVTDKLVNVETEIYAELFRQYRLKYSHLCIYPPTPDDNNPAIRKDVVVRSITIEIHHSDTTVRFARHLRNLIGELEESKQILKDRWNFSCKSETLKGDIVPKIVTRLDVDILLTLVDTAVLSIMSWMFQNARNLRSLKLQSKPNVEMGVRIMEILIINDLMRLDGRRLSFADMVILEKFLELQTPLKVVGIGARSVLNLNIFRQIAAKHGNCVLEFEAGFELDVCRVT